MKDQPRIDLEQEGMEAARLLSELIQINTTNPPGNEIAACRHLEPLYKSLGLEVEVVEPAPGRGSIIGRMKAENPKGAPLLLLSHLDVVPAEDEGWERPPFSGALLRGAVYGRGALDCKNATAVEFYALKRFLELGKRPCRDIILAATADEEAGGKWGVEWLVENRPDLLDAGFCINEGGGFGWHAGDREFYFCQTAEKGVCWFRLVAEGPSGHASLPREDSAMDRMLDALQTLRKNRENARLCKTVEFMFRSLSAAGGNELSPERLHDPGFLRGITESMPSPELRRIFKALVQNTLTVTVVHGGSKSNVIPSRVEAVIDCRLIPGEDPEELHSRVRETAAAYGVEVEPIVKGGGVETEPGGELYEAIAQATAELRPGSVLAPFLVPGGTDGRFLASKGVQVFGFIPLLAEPAGELSIFKLAHGKNEQVKIADLGFGVRTLARVLELFCG